MTKEGKELNYLRQKFPCISEAKIKEGIFVGPLIKQLFQGPYFNNKLNAAQIKAMDAIENVWINCLGNKKNQKTMQHVLKLHILQSHVDFFPRKYGCRLWQAWWKDPSGYILNGKKKQQQIDSKYVG